MPGRVLVTDPWIDLELAREALGPAGVTVEATRDLAGDDVVALLVGIDLPIGRNELARMPSLRAVATCSTGYDHIDIEAMSAAGVWVCHAGDYCADEVAEHTIAFAVALLRGVVPLDRQVRAGGWDVFGVPPRRVHGSVLGVLGCGRIGGRVARLGVALGMRVFATDPHVDPGQVRETGAEPVALPELLAGSDVLTVHTWLDASTHHLIGAAELSALRPGSFLVNCARAGIVDHAALGEALRSGHLAGAALDVLPEEPPPAEAAELDWPGTILNPHAAWHSEGAKRELHRRPAHDLMLVLTGGEPLHPVLRGA